MVRHTLTEFGEDILQHGRPRPDEVHPVVAEIAPDQRLRTHAGLRRVICNRFRGVQNCSGFTRRQRGMRTTPGAIRPLRW